MRSATWSPRSPPRTNDVAAARSLVSLERTAGAGSSDWVMMTRWALTIPVLLLSACASAATTPARQPGVSGIVPVTTLVATPYWTGEAATGTAAAPTTGDPFGGPSIDPNGPLTVLAAGGHLTLRVGERRAVRLVPPGLEGAAWRRLTVTHPDVLAVRDERGGYPGTGVLAATLVALRTGRAVASSQTDQACLHTSPPCLPPQLGWFVVVTVRA